MDREKEIEEMAKTVYNGCRVACSDCRERALCEVRHVAEVLVDEGYRKADEVRKETAKEVLFALLDKKFEMDDKGRVCIVDIYDELNRLFEKYGVEVE